MRRRLLLSAVCVGLFLAGTLIAVTSANAFCRSTIDPTCQPANAPLLVDAGVISGVPTAAVSTGTTATSAVAVASGSAGSLGSTLAPALGGTAGLLLLGGGLAAYDWWIGDDPPLPDGTASPTGTTFSVEGTGLNRTYGGASSRAVPVSWGGEWSVAPGPDLAQVSLTGTVGTAEIPLPECTAGNGLWCASVTPSIKFERYCMWSETGVEIGSPYSGSSGSVLTRVNGFSSSFSFSPSTCGAGREIKRVHVTYSSGLDGASNALASFDIDFQPLPSDDPLRTIEQTVTCKDAAGDVTTVTSETTAFQATPGSVVPVAGLQCPDGDRVVKVTRVVKTPGAPDVELPAINAPPELDVIPATCFSAAVGCRMDLQRRTNTGTWTTDIPESLEWPEVAQDPEDYRCRMGDPPSVAWVPVPLRWCKVMFPYPDPNAPGDTRVDGPPSPDPVSEVAPNPTPDGGGDCDLGWSDLFTGGVFIKGSKCVLQWAFVPSALTMWDLSMRLNVAVGGTAPGQAVSAVSDFVDPLSDLNTEADCLGPEVHMPAVRIEHWRPFAACTGVARTMSDWWLPLATMLVYVGVAFTAVRMVLSTVNAPSHLQGGDE